MEHNGRLAHSRGIELSGMSPPSPVRILVTREHVGYGSFADIALWPAHFRFTPESRHRRLAIRCLFRATSGHSGYSVMSRVHEKQCSGRKAHRGIQEFETACGNSWRLWIR
jgi:hypothetical protein